LPRLAVRTGIGIYLVRVNSPHLAGIRVNIAACAIIIKRVAVGYCAMVRLDISSIPAQIGVDLGVPAIILGLSKGREQNQ